MANPQTTHVIEIETGIGEPAFIPLSMGHELQPISVGKKGMWRIESPRVLDVHAFVYFDGSSLFLQSADEQNAASVDGYRVGKAWTELHAPCKIEIGNARLRYRSLIADADNQPTMMAQAPPVQAGPGGPGSPLGPGGPGSPLGPPGPTGSRPGGGPGASMPVAGAPPAPGGSQPGLSFPKAERPFKPGEFSSAPDTDESTRIAPLDATGGGRVASGSHPRPAAGQSGDDPSTRPEAARVMRGQSGAVAAIGGPFDGMGMQGAPPGNPMQSGAFPQQGFPQPQQPFANQSYPGAGAAGSGQYGVIPGPPGMPGPMDPSMPPGGYGSMTPQGGMQQPVAQQGAPNDAKKSTSIPKIIASLLFIGGSILYLAVDDDPAPPKKKPVAAADAGAGETGSVAATGTGAVADASAGAVVPPVMGQATTVAPAWPPGVPCPPPNWPANTPLPCTPNGLSNPPDRNPPDKGGKDAGSKDAGTKSNDRDTLPAGVKTLERQAVDYVAAGDTAKAAAAYEELVRRDPNNKVYAEAARILRGKLDAGSPQ